MPEHEFRARLIQEHGTLKTAMKLIQATFSENEAAIDKAFPPPSGQRPLQVGRKPLDGEEVTFAPLDDNLAIRVWGGDLAQSHAYCFDFINRQRQYIRTPSGLKIYAETNSFNPSGEVLSIEASLERTMAQSRQFQTTMELARGGQAVDPNWETYIIPEGTRLRITQLGKADSFLTIPIRTPNGRTLTLRRP